MLRKLSTNSIFTRRCCKNSIIPFWWSEREYQQPFWWSEGLLIPGRASSFISVLLLLISCFSVGKATERCSGHWESSELLRIDDRRHLPSRRSEVTTRNPHPASAAHDLIVRIYFPNLFSSPDFPGSRGSRQHRLDSRLDTERILGAIAGVLIVSNSARSVWLPSWWSGSEGSLRSDFSAHDFKENNCEWSPHVSTSVTGWNICRIAFPGLLQPYRRLDRFFLIGSNRFPFNHERNQFVVLNEIKSQGTSIHYPSPSPSAYLLITINLDLKM